MPEQNQSGLLPRSPFDQTLAQLIGLPNGAHTDPSVVQTRDFYGNSTDYIVQTVKWDEGETVFLHQVNAEGSHRYMLPPKVVQTILRQRDSVITQVRRRHGKRIAAERKAAGYESPLLNPEVRARAIASRLNKKEDKGARNKKATRGR